MAGSQGQPEEIRLSRVLGATSSLLWIKGPFGIDLTFEPGQEGGARWCGVCRLVSHSCVQLMGR